MLGAIVCTFQPWVWARLRWLPALAFSSPVRAGLAVYAGMVRAYPGLK